MAKWDLSKLNNSGQDEIIETFLSSIERKCDIIRMDAKRDPKRLTIKQRSEEIMAITKLLRSAIGSDRNER